MRKTIFFLILTAAFAVPPLASAQNAVAGATAPDPSASMARLQEAAQRLRESVQAMAQQPAGERRNQAAAAAREALVETQEAMVMLPPELRTAGK